ncbi:hypothetical protein B0T24DRAFT_363263 [Lasiosphaeria ovina]|uniref:Uncharacterized protein n=1 Tax=Lasiosphaeria ovina TaxID=92902 RepID=A0AAE0K441_9PEZI|nr:hypothetical protein B0T24DRAFT_363263 [Lasiosphaeria ovina]
MGAKSESRRQPSVQRKTRSGLSLSPLLLPVGFANDQHSNRSSPLTLHCFGAGQAGNSQHMLSPNGAPNNAALWNYSTLECRALSVRQTECWCMTRSKFRCRPISSTATSPLRLDLLYLAAQWFHSSDRACCATPMSCQTLVCQSAFHHASLSSGNAKTRLVRFRAAEYGTAP